MVEAGDVPLTSGPPVVIPRVKRAIWLPIPPAAYPPGRRPARQLRPRGVHQRFDGAPHRASLPGLHELGATCRLGEPGNHRSIGERQGLSTTLGNTSRSSATSMDMRGAGTAFLQS